MDASAGIALSFGLAALWAMMIAGMWAAWKFRDEDPGGDQGGGH